MAPFLRNGHPVGQRVRIRHHVAYYCRCQDCLLHTSFNPLTSQFTSGREFGEAEFRRHQAFLDQQQRSMNEMGSNHHSLPAGPSSFDHSLGDSSVITDDLLLQLQSELRSRRDNLQDFRELIFSSPPKPSDMVPPPKPSGDPPLSSSTTSEISQSEINHGPFTLDYSRRVNQPILEHLQWLQDVTLDIDAMSISPELRSSRKALIDEIEKEICRVEVKKADEWYRQYEEQSRARNLIKERLVTVVDSGILACLKWSWACSHGVQ